MNRHRVRRTRKVRCPSCERLVRAVQISITGDCFDCEIRVSQGLSPVGRPQSSVERRLD